MARPGSRNQAEEIGIGIGIGITIEDAGRQKPIAITIPIPMPTISCAWTCIQDSKLIRDFFTPCGVFLW